MTEEIKTIEDIDGTKEEPKEETIDEKYSKLSLDYDELRKKFDEVSRKYNVALEENNKLYKRITTPEDYTEPKTSLTDELIKTYK